MGTFVTEDYVMGDFVMGDFDPVPGCDNRQTIFIFVPGAEGNGWSVNPISIKTKSLHQVSVIFMLTNILFFFFIL